MLEKAKIWRNIAPPIQLSPSPWKTRRIFRLKVISGSIRFDLDFVFSKVMFYEFSIIIGRQENKRYLLWIEFRMFSSCPFLGPCLNTKVPVSYLSVSYLTMLRMIFSDTNLFYALFRLRILNLLSMTVKSCPSSRQQRRKQPSYRS